MTIAAAASATAADIVSSRGPDTRRGAELLEQYQCGGCHAIPGVAHARGTFAVSLDAFGRRSYIAGRWPNRADVLQRWIIDPPALAPGTLMPRLGVGATDARDMAGYLLSLQ